MVGELHSRTIRVGVRGRCAGGFLRRIALGVLNPKSGGFRTLLSQFSGQVNCLDITLKYHPKVPSYLDVFWGEGYRIEIWVEQHQLSSSMTPQEIRLWLQERWKFKQDRVQNNV